MTTIAWDGKTLAADGQVTVGDSGIMTLKRQKIFKNVGMFDVLAFAGSLEPVGEFLEWAKNPGDGVPPEGEYTVIFAVDGTLHYSHMKTPIMQSVEIGKGDIDAWGSGAAYALGAMRSGKTAVQAVNIAIQCDAYTGGKVRSVRILK